MEVVIYSKDNCAFCDKAIKLAFIKEARCEVKKLGVDFEMEDMMKLFPTARTFPQIILDGKNIGGYTEFEVLVK